MKTNIKGRVLQLIALVQEVPLGQEKVRPFCLQHNISYIALYNSFKADAFSIKTVDAFKKAVPTLNVNWLLYDEGTVFMTPCFGSKMGQTKSNY